MQVVVGEGDSETVGVKLLVEVGLNVTDEVLVGVEEGLELNEKVRD